MKIPIGVPVYSMYIIVSTRNGVLGKIISAYSERGQKTVRLEDSSEYIYTQYSSSQAN